MTEFKREGDYEILSYTVKRKVFQTPFTFSEISPKIHDGCSIVEKVQLDHA